ncbi:DUF927 domain-containing protein [Psychrobacter sp. 72-O-c]|uniref:DUF927 domain-containing protein n=1 Tax=Psychrobacter sp. 72-O-c TaxID=2774125 RepID=UPI001D112498|nr:DUF927 domain-containing protein [Psychrobacter sp. 72-O-c]
MDNNDIIRQVETYVAKISKPQIDKGFTRKILHIYADADSKFIYGKLRLKNLTTGDKYIRSISQDSAGMWQMKDPDFKEVYSEGGGKKPLYRRHDLACDTEAVVYIFEGEQKADLANEFGFIATTSGGSTQVNNYHWLPLAGRDICLWADNDAAGVQWLEGVYKELNAIGARIKIIDIDVLGLAEKGDIVDWVELQRQADPDITHQQLAGKIKELDTLTDEQLSIILADDLPEPSSDSIAVSYPEWRKDTQLNEPMVHEGGRFELYSDGLFFVKYDDSDPTNILFKLKMFICSPLEVIATARDASNKNWGRLLKWHDADGVIHQWSMPVALLQSDAREYRRELASQGLNITINRKQRDYLDAYIQDYPSKKRARCVTKLGWHGEQYVLPDHTLGGAVDANEVIVYQSAHAIDSTLSQQGELAQWTDKVCKPMADQSRLVFSLCCAFAGQLLEPLGSDGGGFHFMGSSSMGKSISLKLAASVWGNPERYVKTWRTTDNALEGTASEYNDSFLGLDEISECDPKKIGNIIYMLSNGQGKGRSTTTGQNRTANKWRLIFLSNGEKSVQQQMAEVGQSTNAGIEIRTAHIDADAGKGYKMFDSLVLANSGAAQADKLTELSSTYYGTAGIAWLEYITMDKAATTITAKALIDDFMNQYDNLAPQAHRVAKRFAIVAAAGEMATLAGITGWQAGQAAAVKVCLDNWLDNYGRDGEQEQRQIIKHIQAFIEQHGSSRFEPRRSHRCPDFEPKTSNRVGYRNTNTGDYLFSVNTFDMEICPPFNAKKVLQVLDEAGLLIRNQGDRKAYKSPKTLFIERDPFYAVKAHILSYEGDKATGTDGTNGTAHIQQALDTVPHLKTPLRPLGQLEPHRDEASQLSHSQKSTGTAINPVITGTVPLSQASQSKKVGTVKPQSFINEPDNEIPPFGSVGNYS